MNIRTLALTGFTAAALTLATGCAAALPLIAGPAAPVTAVPAAPVTVTAAPVTVTASAEPTEEPTTEEPTTDYTQTWKESYSTTDCNDWSKRMSSHEKFVMAADFLVGENEDSGLPTDEMVNTLKYLLGSMCDNDTNYVMATAAEYLFAADDGSLLTY